MAINLNKSENKGINLTKAAPALKNLKVFMWWKDDFKIDLDLSAFVLKNTPDGPKLISDNHLVFYNNPASPDGAVKAGKDERAGGSEEITINIPSLQSEVDEISFVVTIDKPGDKSFGSIKEAGVKFINEDTGEDIAFFDLDEQFSNETAVQLGSFYKNGTEFSFTAVGAGFVLTLGDFVAGYQ